MATRDEDAQRAKSEGRYANCFEIGHNAVEFVLDFGQCYSEGEATTLHTRIVTTPIYAKRLLGVLEESIARYEATYGPIVNDFGWPDKKTQ